MSILETLEMPGHPTQWKFVESEKPQRPPLWWIVPDTGRSNVPLTCQFRPEITSKFTSELQDFVFNLNRTGNDAGDRMAFQGYRDTWNTRGKVRDNYNAITGEGDPSSLPTLEFNIGFAANVVTGEVLRSDGSYGIPFGVWCLKMETININNPLPVGYTYESHPWLIHHQIITIGVIRNRFPQLGGKPIFTPLWSKVPMYIEMSKLQQLHADDDIPSPYYHP